MATAMVVTAVLDKSSCFFLVSIPTPWSAFALRAAARQPSWTLTRAMNQPGGLAKPKLAASGAKGGLSSEARMGASPPSRCVLRWASFACNQLSKDGGERGIRTPGPVSEPTVFKTAALNHSAISPRERVCTRTHLLNLVCPDHRHAVHERPQGVRNHH